MIKYIGVSRMKFIKKLQEILMNNGYMVTLEETYNLWVMYCKDVICIDDWIYPDDDITDDDLFKKVEEFIQND